MALKKKKRVKKVAKKITKKAVKKQSVKKKANKRKPVAKRKPVPKNKSPKKEGNLIGLITHYFPHVQAAVIKLRKPLATGDTIKIKGHTTDITQVATSIQIDRMSISSAKKGDEIGLEVISRVRQQDKVYKV